VTIKLNIPEVTAAALHVFRNLGSEERRENRIDPTPRETLVIGAVVWALCEALEAATAGPEPAPERCGVYLTHSSDGILHSCNLPAGHVGRHEWCGDRALECRHEIGAGYRCNLGVGHSGGCRFEGGRADRSDVGASPELVAHLIGKAKAGEGRRTVAAVVHHYETRIARALELADRTQIAYETEADRVDDMVDALRGGAT
jgi:hypothetical protein